MIIVHLQGGLGNQMFQYAFGYALAKKNNDILKLDISSYTNNSLRDYLLNSFYIIEIYATQEEVIKLKYNIESILQRFFNLFKRKSPKYPNSYYKEEYFHYIQNIKKNHIDMYYEGYWQSPKYFQDFQYDLIKQFTPKNKLDIKTQKYYDQIRISQSISLHVRRGDYVTNVTARTILGTCDLVYYRKAVSFLKSKVSNPHFFIFSDDLAWAKENLDFLDNITFVELEKDVPDHEEMYLMSQCRHNIIANSSFSWWGAWLNQYPDKIVIAPKRWFNDLSINTSDLIPESWICL